MAWGKILDHPRLAELDSGDLAKLLDELKDKVRCYGYDYVTHKGKVQAANQLLDSAP